MTAGGRASLVTAHARALYLLEAQPDLRLRQLAERLDVTARTAQQIVTDLEAQGLLCRSRVGRHNQYRVIHLPWLRHAIEHDRLLVRPDQQPRSDIA